MKNMSKGSKKGEKKMPVYVTDTDKKNHFVAHANKCVKIIDKQLSKLAKISKARTFIYSPEQVEKINVHVQEQLAKTISSLQGKVESKDSFNVGL
jgi:hypothetical protein